MLLSKMMRIKGLPCIQVLPIEGGLGHVCLVHKRVEQTDVHGCTIHAGKGQQSSNLCKT